MGSDFKSYKETPNDVLTESEIITILDNENCQFLQDRPKLVFIQACQGEKDDHGVNKGEGTGENPVADGETDDDDNESDDGAVAASGIIDGENSEEQGTLPKASDMMICYSTISGYKSYVEKTGSVFGIALARALINHSHDTDLQSLLNLISAEMKAESVNGVGKKVKQIPEVKLKGWTKKIFFNPGNPRTPNPNKRKAAATIAPDAYDSTKKRSKLTKDVTDEQMPINLENITEQPEIPQNRPLNTIEPTVENQKTNEKPKPKSKKRAKTETKENSHKVTDENSKNSLPSITQEERGVGYPDIPSGFWTGKISGQCKSTYMLKEVDKPSRASELAPS